MEYLLYKNVSHDKLTILSDSLLVRNIVFTLLNEFKNTDNSLVQKIQKSNKILENCTVLTAIRNPNLIKPYFNSNIKIRFVQLLSILLRYRFKYPAYLILWVSRKLVKI